MAIKLHCTVFSDGYLSGGGIVCTGLIDSIEYYREFGYSYGNCELLHAEILTASLALKSVTLDYKYEPIVLNCNTVVSDLLYRIGKSFKKDPDDYQLEIAELRRWFLYYDRIKCVDVPADRARATEIAEHCTINSVSHDYTNIG